MIIRSDCRGEPRNTSAPKRAISNREALIDIISMAQQARPKVIGQMEFLRAQLIGLIERGEDDAFRGGGLRRWPPIRCPCARTVPAGRWRRVYPYLYFRMTFAASARIHVRLR